MPEQGHDLPERSGRAHHLAQPPRAQVVHLVRVACGRAPVVVGQHVRRRVGPATLRIAPGVSDPVGRRRPGRPGGAHDQRLHRLLPRHRGQAGHGLRRRAERGATQQMRGGGGVPGVARVLSSGHRSSRSGYEIDATRTLAASCSGRNLRSREDCACVPARRHGDRRRSKAARPRAPARHPLQRRSARQPFRPRCATATTCARGTARGDTACTRLPTVANCCLSHNPHPAITHPRPHIARRLIHCGRRWQGLRSGRLPRP